MSLLNDALRKKSSETKKNENVHVVRKKSVSPKFNGVKISRICGLLLLFSILVYGAWYLLASSSAQVDAPISSNAAQHNIELNTSIPVSDLENDRKKEIKPVPIVPKPVSQNTLPQELPKTEPVKNDKQAVKYSPEKVSPRLMATSKAAKKQHRVKIKSFQKGPKKKAKSLPSREENLFFQKALRYHRQGKLNQAVRMYHQFASSSHDPFFHSISSNLN